MKNYLIKNVNIVNEGITFTADVFIKNERIEKIASNINAGLSKVVEIDGEGKYLLPGVIDDQVHFRDPGLTHKADIHSESKAAVAGGVTTFMDMPNTKPPVLTLELLEEKYALAAQKSLANYSFFMGISKNNLEEALKIDNENVCGITDDGLYFSDDEGIMANYPDFLEQLFSRSHSLIALHSEDDRIIKNNTEFYKKIYGEDIPFRFHPKIRSEEACLTATKRVLEIARKHGNRLHFFHISTLAEAQLFDNTTPSRNKKITAEVCVHHLWFSDEDYDKLGAKIKWNPAVKTKKDKEGLLEALLTNHIDIIATDHAPHTIEEKSGNYFRAMSGGPLVQHSLVMMLEFCHQNKITIEKVVEKMSHSVADIYRIIDRGYIREGYFADLVLVDLNQPWTVEKNNLLYKCGWSPLEGTQFRSKVLSTWVSGHLVYHAGNFDESCRGKRLKFEKIR